MKRPLNRVPVTASPDFYTTFSIQTTDKEHWRKATCEEVNCPYYIKGYKVETDESKPVGQKNAHLLRTDRSRKYTETRNEYGMTVFTYPVGTACMNLHKVRIEKPEIFVVKGGDHRGNPKGIPTRVHTKAEFWAEEFSETQDKIIKRIEMRD